MNYHKEKIEWSGYVIRLLVESITGPKCVDI